MCGSMFHLHFHGLEALFNFLLVGRAVHNFISRLCLFFFFNQYVMFGCRTLVRYRQGTVHTFMAEMHN